MHGERSVPALTATATARADPHLEATTMNYYEARKRESDGRWDYTCMNDGRIWPIGNCANAGGGHHETAEEARVCYTRFLLDTRMNLDGHYADQQLRCDVCQAFTSRYATVDHRHFPLCDAHCTREKVTELFGTVGSITSSW